MHYLRAFLTIAVAVCMAAATAHAGDDPFGDDDDYTPSTGTAPPASSTTGGLPAPAAEPGLRLGFGFGVAVPNGDFGEGDGVNASPHLSLRLGNELMYGAIGIEPAARFDFIYWMIDDDDFKLYMIQALANVRAKVHLGRIAPAFGLGLGLGASMNNEENLDAGLGAAFNIEIGADIILSESVGLGLAFNIHPGFVDLFKDIDDVLGADLDVTYWGFQASLITY